MFKNAYFGKAYRTKDGSKAIYHSIGSKIEEDGDHLLIIENRYGYYHYDNSGKYYHLDRDLDIVSEWEETIDEKELDKLANSASNELYSGFEQTKCIWESGFKAGYRKAKEE